MYAPGGNFHRDRWDWMNRNNRIKPGVNREFNSVSRDSSSVPSNKVSGLQIPIRIYEPLRDENAPLAELPIMVFYHGGGFCMMDAENAQVDRECAMLECR